jgi:DNA helicase-2/ATP-dependent DNA helicase PcrA
VVGDDWQSIYGFRGSGPEPFFEFPNRFSGTKVHTLAYNYRSRPNLVRMSKTPILKNKNYYPKEVISARKGKGIWQKWITDSPDSIEFLEAVQYKVMNEKFQILCRSNFRIQEWLKQGIPSSSICTIHASKGLEYDSVFCDLVSGWNHIQEEYLEEERRILYVALSRAKNQLITLGSTEARDKSLGDFLFQELPGRVTRKFLGNVVVKRGWYLF